MLVATLAWAVFSVRTVTTAQSTPAIVGYIAYVGSDHNVYVTDGSETLQLTRDGGPARRYQFPTWSTDGRLAFFCCNPGFTARLGIEIYAATVDLTAAKLLYSVENEGYTYSYWSPENCAAGPTCRDLAVLITQPGRPFKVELVRQNGAETTARSIATGAPFYFSWNRDGNRMLWYRNESVVTLFDAGANSEPSDLSVTPRGFQAPTWSPVDDRAAMVLSEASGNSNALVVIDGEQQRTLVQGIPADIRGFANITAMSWSPNGRYLAYRVINRIGASPLFIIDFESGATVATSSEPNVLAFFWSPDSTRIAYISPTTADGGAGTRSFNVSSQRDPETLLTWSTLTVSTSEVQKLTGFTPTREMTYLLSYFDQFGQSHRLWSPDSRYIVYGDSSSGGISSVKVLDTLADSPVPFTLSEGEIGIWSFR